VRIRIAGGRVPRGVLGRIELGCWRGVQVRIAGRCAL